ncbi:MAG: hypothetical protein GQ547_03210 [Methylophaga sp.]|nr:hypothetical protein [Methylophaga sp.]
MGIFSSLFGNKKNLKPHHYSQQKSETESRLFRPELVDSLTHDHQTIITLLNEINELINNQDFKSIDTKIQELRLQLQNHVIVENVQLYSYLEMKLNNDPNNLEFIQRVRKEMNHISHTVVQFSRRYEAAHFTEQLQQKFTRDLKAIGDMIRQRIAMEEGLLYTLYKA